MGERLARLEVAFEGEESRPHRIVQPAVGHDHVKNGLRLDLVPNADGLKESPRRCNDSGRTSVIGRASQRRIRNSDGERGPESLTQRNGQREAGEAAAADQHIDTFGCPFAFHRVDIPHAAICTPT